MKIPTCLLTSGRSLPAHLLSFFMFILLFPQYTLIAQVSAAFTVDVDSGAAPLTVQFLDQSTPQDSLILREWDLDGDGVTDSNEKNPYWTYEVPGLVTVTLIVADSMTRETARSVDFIEVAPVEENDIACLIQIVEKNAPTAAYVELWGYEGSGIPGPIAPVSLRMPLDTNNCAVFYKGKFLNVLTQNITDLLVLDGNMDVIGKVGFSYMLKDFVADRRKDAIVIVHRDLVSWQNHPREQSASARWIYPRKLRFPYLSGYPLSGLAASGDDVNAPLYQTTLLIPPVSYDIASSGRAQFRLLNIRQDRIPYMLLHGLGETDGCRGLNTHVVLPADTLAADFNGKRDYAFTSYTARLQHFDRIHADRFDVWEYYYPADQHWEESGFLFARDLDYLLSLYDTTTAAVAAHGMGGLVLRSYLEETANNYTYFAAATGNASFRDDIYKAVFLGTPHSGRLLSGSAYAAPDDMLFPNVMDRYAPALRELMPGRASLARLNSSNIPLNTEILNIAGNAPIVQPMLPVESALHDDGRTALSSSMLTAPKAINAVLGGYASEMLLAPEDAASRFNVSNRNLIPEILYAFAVSDSTLEPYRSNFLVYNNPDTLRFTQEEYQHSGALPLRADVGLPELRLLLQGMPWPADRRMRLRLDTQSGNRLFVERLDSYADLDDQGLFLYPSTLTFSGDGVAQQAADGPVTFFPVSRAGAAHPFRGGLLSLDGLGWQLPMQQESILSNPVLARIDDIGRGFNIVRSAGDLQLQWARETRNAIALTLHEALLLDPHHPLKGFTGGPSALIDVETDCLTHALSVVVDYSGCPEPTLSVTAPDNTWVTSAMANDTTILYTHNPALRMKAMTIMQPQIGEWLILLDGVSTLPTGCNVAMSVDAARDLHLSITPDDPLSRDTVIAVAALEAGPAVTEPMVTMVIIDSADARRTVTLADNGVLPDTTAGDGVFAGLAVLGRAGSYRIEGYYSAKSSGCPILRRASLPLNLPPSLELLQPVGGELWRTGQARPLLWQGERPTQVYVDFSTNGGADWTQIAGPLDTDDGGMVWTVPSVTSTTCRVRVRDAANAALYDISPANFTVYEAPVITVEQPDGGEHWQVDDTHTIRWTTIAVAALDIAYSTDNGGSWNSVAGSIPAVSGSYDWRLPLTPSTQCLVRLTDSSDPSTFDVSDAVFTLTPIPAVELISPNGGERWQVGTLQRVRWHSAAVDSIMLRLSGDGGRTWEFLTREDADAGEWFWTIPARVSDQCLLQIQAAHDGSLMDESDKEFSIIPEPFIQLLAPVGGERWEMGTTQTVRWTSAGISAVDVDYTTDNGQHWTTAAVNVPAGPGRYDWDIPAEPSEFCRVRIHDTYDSSRQRVSPDVFAISESQTRPTLYAPTNGSEGVSTRPRFRWLPFSGATSYHLQVSNDPTWSFFVIDNDQVTTSSFQSHELDRDTKYYWRVMARSGSGQPSEWSTTWNFTTSGSTLTAPRHELPLNGSIGQALLVNISWHAVDSADAYHLQVAGDEQFQNLLLDQMGLTGLVHAVTGLENEKDYWWRLRSGNTGTTAFSDWSSPWKFSTLPAPPRQLTPFDGLPDVPLRPLLQWYPTSGARVYRLQVGADQNFNTVVYDSSTIQGTAIQLPQLWSFSTFFWRLTVTTGRGTSDWSDVWFFRTIDVGTNIDTRGTLPDQPQLVSLYPLPAGDQLNVLYTIPHAAYVHFTISDLLGRTLREFSIGENRPGSIMTILDLYDVPPGNYILTLNAGDSRATRLLTIR